MAGRGLPLPSQIYGSEKPATTATELIGESRGERSKRTAILAGFARCMRLTGRSGKAIARMHRQTPPLPIICLHQLAFRNALRLRVFRKEITHKQPGASLNAMLADTAAGVFAISSLPIADVMMNVFIRD